MSQAVRYDGEMIVLSLCVSGERDCVLLQLVTKNYGIVRGSLGANTE
jgi:hypothetical protein